MKVPHTFVDGILITAWRERDIIISLFTLLIDCSDWPRAIELCDRVRRNFINYYVHNDDDIEIMDVICVRQVRRDSVVLAHNTRRC